MLPPPPPPFPPPTEHFATNLTQSNVAGCGNYELVTFPVNVVLTNIRVGPISFMPSLIECCTACDTSFGTSAPPSPPPNPPGETTVYPTQPVMYGCEFFIHTSVACTYYTPTKDHDGVHFMEASPLLQGHHRVYRRVRPSPPPSPPASPEIDPAFVVVGCPTTAPNAGDACSSNTCEYNPHCCGTVCQNTTTAECTNGTWEVYVVGTTPCPTHPSTPSPPSSPLPQPSPPVPPPQPPKPPSQPPSAPSSDSGLQGWLIAVIVLSGTFLLIAVVAIVFLILYCNGYTNRFSRVRTDTAGTTSSSKANVASVGDIASDSKRPLLMPKPWQFNSLRHDPHPKL